MKTKEEKQKEVRKAALDLKAKAIDLGISGPFVSWVWDAERDGILVLDAPGPVDSSSIPTLSWDSNKFFVVVFSQSRNLPVHTFINF